MNSSQYQLAGWLAIIGALLMVPLTVATVILEKMSGGHLLFSIINIGKYFLSMAVTVYIFYMFRKLLNDRYNFNQVNWIITVFIIYSILTFFVSLLAIVPDLKLAVMIGILVMMVPFGVLNIIFGVRMLKLQDDLFGLLKPFAYLYIAAGICAVSVILMPLGMLVAIATLFIEGMIFLRTKEQVEFV